MVSETTGEIIATSASFSEEKKGKNKSLRHKFFAGMSHYLEEREVISPILSYTLGILETLSFLYFLIHPSLKIVKENSFFLQELMSLLKFVNFFEFLRDGTNSISLLTPSLALIAIQILLICFSVGKEKTQYSKYVKRIANIQFIVIVKGLSGPFLGLAVNTLYCSSGSPYHSNIQCYDLQHSISCALAVILLLIVGVEVIIFSLFYYSKNIFDGGCLGHPNRNYMLSRGLLKLIFPIALALNIHLNLNFLFLIFAPILWGGYLFFHRINGLRSFNHQHSYFQYFFECFLFWMAIFNILCYYIKQTPQEMIVIYMTLASVTLAYTMINIEKQFEEQLMDECLESKMKKQSMEKFFFLVAHKLLHVSSSPHDKRRALKVFSQIFQISQYSSCQIEYQEENISENELKTNIYEFLMKLLNRYLKESKSLNLKIQRCYLLRILDYKHHSLHQILELQQQKHSFVESFFLFDFKKESQHLQLYKIHSDADTMYRYQEENCLLETLFEQCAQNNCDFWDQLCQPDPSVPKLRNLAKNYTSLSKKIVKTYENIKQIMPDSHSPTINYLHFLLQVGVDSRQTTRIKDELKMQVNSFSPHKNQQKLNLDEECMIAVDSVGKKLGSIVNCNSKTKDLLGYYKDSLINKNITRIMPRVYTELHNSFLLNFIKKKNLIIAESHQQITEVSRKQVCYNNNFKKIVTPLSKQGYLVEANLTIHAINSANSSLLIIGFMTKRQTEEGTIMTNMDGQVLAIDKNFMSLMKKKVTGRQIIQQELKISALLPEINLLSLEKEGFQESHLENGNAIDEESSNTLTKVEVKIKSSKMYEGHHLIFLSIQHKAVDENLKYIVNFVRRNGTTIKPTPTIELGLPTSKIPFKKLNQIQSDEIQTLTEVDNSDSTDEKLSKDFQLKRKLDDFTEKKRGKHLSILIKGCYLIILLILTLYLGITFFMRCNYMEKTKIRYRTIQLMADTLYQSAQVNLYNNRIWCVLSSHYFRTRHVSFAPMAVAVTQLANNYRQVVEATMMEDYPLEYNQNIFRNFTLYARVGRSHVWYNISMSFKAALQNYINCGKKMQNATLVAEMKNVNRYFVMQQADFITKNGDELIPSIAIQSIYSYMTLFTSQSSHEKIKTIVLKSILIILGIVCLVGIISLGKYLNKVQGEVFVFYSKLKLWDIHELSTKCSDYLKKRGKQVKKNRDSSLLKIFPSKVFVDIINYPQSGNMKKSKRNTSLVDLEEQERKLRFDDPSFKDEDNNLQDKEGYVNIEWEGRHHKAICIISLVIVAALVLLGVSMYCQYQTAIDLENKFELVKNLGIIRKSLTYLNLFAYRIIASHADRSYSTKIGPEAALFYQYSNKVYQQLGNNVLKDIYGEVEVLQTYFIYPYTYSKTFLQGIYNSKTDSSLTAATNRIMEMMTTIFRPAFFSSIDTDIQRELIFTLVLGLLGFMLIFLVHLIYIHPIYVQRDQAICMLQIIPVWVIERNPKIYNQIA